MAQHGTTWEYLLPDALGSVRQIVDANRNVTLAESYEPYGSVLSSNGTASSIFAYAGEQLDTTGLIYLRARYMNPRLGMFLTEDTVPGRASLPRSLHIYVYAWNNPINLLDPSGKQSPVPCDPDGLCATQPTGGYVVQTPPINPPQPPSRSMRSFSLPKKTPTDGLYIIITHDTRAFDRFEASMEGGGLKTPWGGGGAERRYFVQTYSDGTVVSGWETNVSGNVGAFGVDYTFTDGSNTWRPNISVGVESGSGGAVVQVQENEISFGLSVGAPGRGARGYLGLALGYEDHFITYRGYFDQIGGENGFVDRHSPGGDMTYFSEVFTDSDPRVCSVSGFSKLVGREQEHWYWRQLSMLAKVVPES